MSDDTAKRAAGEAAAALVEDGMRVGLGTGSTARWFIAALGERVARGLRVNAVPTSRASAEQAASLGILTGELGVDGLDLAVDGADAVDTQLRLIKGGGGAHVRERIVAAAARRFVVVVDETKVVKELRGPLPLEILEFGAERTLATVAGVCGAPAAWRRQGVGGDVRQSDNGNRLADVGIGAIPDAEGLAAQLDQIAGLVGHGLFLGMADLVIVGSADSGVRHMEPQT